MKRNLALLLVLLALLVARCKTEYEITINSDLSGTAVVSALTGGMISPYQLKQDLDRRGIKNFSVSQFTRKENIQGKTMEIPGLKVIMPWRTEEEFQKAASAMGGMRTEKPFVKNADGTVLVNLGVVSNESTMKITIEGTIDPKSTQGKINGNTVEFGPTQLASLNFTPGAGAGNIVKFVGIGIAILAIISIAVFMMKRKKVGPVAASSTLSAEAAEPATHKAKQEATCPKCNAPINKDNTFCAGCGTKIG